MTDTPEEVNNKWQLAAFFVSKHGTVTIGVIIALVMNQFIFAPLLERSAVDVQAMREITSELKSQQTATERLAEHLRTTTTILDEVVKRIED